MVTSPAHFALARSRIFFAKNGHGRVSQSCPFSFNQDILCYNLPQVWVTASGPLWRFARPARWVVEQHREQRARVQPQQQSTEQPQQQRISAGVCAWLHIFRWLPFSTGSPDSAPASGGLSTITTPLPVYACRLRFAGRGPEKDEMAQGRPVCTQIGRYRRAAPVSDKYRSLGAAWIRSRRARSTNRLRSGAANHLTNAQSPPPCGSHAHTALVTTSPNAVPAANKGALCLNGCPLAANVAAESYRPCSPPPAAPLENQALHCSTAESPYCDII